ncbi:hypothetical protein Sango_1264500 [Sesamum angolense]|uniref:Uncharacterized protein n=1 Tax=Sesamum angolense TaxID=2727404 RepID=A0AAE1WQX2_9LAMI|nr:hypothetical protein Sango_1264500 [Sesamum angolense]
MSLFFLMENMIGGELWVFTGNQALAKERRHGICSRFYALSLNDHGFVPGILRRYYQSEKAGGSPCPFWKMQNFRQALVKSGLSDISFLEPLFISNNKKHHSYIVREHLDRACASTDWIVLFPNVIVSHLPISCSYFLPLFIALSQQPKLVGNKVRSFIFEAAWLQSVNREEVVLDR